MGPLSLLAVQTIKSAKMRLQRVIARASIRTLASTPIIINEYEGNYIDAARRDVRTADISITLTGHQYALLNNEREHGGAVRVTRRPGKNIVERFV